MDQNYMDQKDAAHVPDGAATTGGPVSGPPPARVAPGLELSANSAGVRTRYPMTADESLELHNQFTYHAPKPDQIPRYTGIRERAYTLAAYISETVPPSPERDASLLLLQQAAMMANAGIARHE